MNTHQSLEVWVRRLQLDIDQLSKQFQKQPCYVDDFYSVFTLIHYVPKKQKHIQARLASMSQHNLRLSFDLIPEPLRMYLSKFWTHLWTFGVFTAIIIKISWGCYLMKTWARQQISCCLVDMKVPSSYNFVIDSQSSQCTDLIALLTRALFNQITHPN